MKKKLKLLFYVAFFSFILIPIFKNEKARINAYNNTIEFYDYYIDLIDSVFVSINIIYQRSGLKVETVLSNNDIINKIKFAIFNSTQEVQDKRIFDYMGTFFLKKDDLNKIEVSFRFDHNSDVIFFKVHKFNEGFGIWYKYIDMEMYFHDYLLEVIENNS